MDNKSENELDFDVVTELTFATKEGYDKIVAGLTDAEIGAIITADEENIFDRSKMRVFIMEEKASAPRSLERTGGRLRGAPALLHHS